MRGHPKPDWRAIAVKQQTPWKQAADQAAEYRERVMARRAGRDPGPPPKLAPRGKPKLTGETWLCIGDAHANPDHPNHRFDWLGRMIVEEKPDLVWDAGDFGDFPSLCHYDYGKKCFEGRRYWKDMEAFLDAQERIQYQLDEYNRGSKRKYRPNLVRTLGNHENRIAKILDLEPRFEGIVGPHDLMSAEFGWEEHEFLDPVVLQGVALSHYWTSGIMGRPIGGEHPATMLIKKQFHTCLQGHSHQLDYADRVDAAGSLIQAMHIGCYFDFDFDWAGKQPNRMYQRGILMLRNVQNGHFDPEWWSIDRVQARYG